MLRTLSTLLADWVGSLRSIVERHPAVFSVSAWSMPHAGETAPPTTDAYDSRVVER